MLSSHIFSEVDATCDTISIIKDGIHVATFKSEDIKNKDTVEYILHFVDKDNLNKFLNKKLPCQVIEVNEKRNLAIISMLKSDYKDFFNYISDIKIREFSEKPFTLQDFFMSFYKEEKDFDGLQGVKGNQK